LRGLVGSALADMVRPPGEAAGPSSPVAGARAGEPAGVDLGTGEGWGAIDLVVRPGAPRRGPAAGRDATAEVWLRNDTAEPVPGVRVHATELRRHDGRVLAAGLAVDPAEVGELPARSSRGIIVAPGPPSPTAGGDEPGTYHGVLLVAGAPEAALPVRVVVR
jgi:hypothetical protein